MLEPFESDLLASCQKILRRKKINFVACCSVAIVMLTASIHAAEMATGIGYLLVASFALLLLIGCVNELIVAAQHVARLLARSDENEWVVYRIVDDYKQHMKNEDT